MIQFIELGNSLSLWNQDFVACFYHKLVQLQQINSMSSYNMNWKQYEC